MRIIIEVDPEHVKIFQRHGFTEVLEAQPEQMESVVRQPDAALSSDESGGSAAGNPDGDVRSQLLARIKSRLATWREAYKHETDPEECKVQYAIIGEYKTLLCILERLGAA